MSMHPSHDPDPCTHQCRRCGMWNEEMLDFSMVECADAAAAQMPVRRPMAAETGLIDNLSLAQAHQRGLMLDGLASRAMKREFLKAEGARRGSLAEIIDAERPE